MAVWALCKSRAWMFMSNGDFVTFDQCGGRRRQWGRRDETNEQAQQRVYWTVLPVACFPWAKPLFILVVSRWFARTDPLALMQARSAYIRSGWKSIFTVLSQAAKDMSSGFSLPRQAWQIVSRLVDEEMGSLVYDFLDVTKVIHAS